MVEIEISNFNDYQKYIHENCSKDYIFRGVSNSDFKLIPKIGRDAYTKNFDSSSSEFLIKLQDLEDVTIAEFIKRAVPYLDMRAYSSWDQWTIAQHFGLPTRFLDWTENPLIAAYFSIEGNVNHNSAIYIINRNQINQNIDSDDPLSLEDDIVLYTPSYINERIIAQKGLFTVHKNPTLPINENQDINLEITKLIIKSKNKREILETLNWYGINRSFIYPGLEGLANYLDTQAQSLNEG